MALLVLRIQPASVRFIIVTQAGKITNAIYKPLKLPKGGLKPDIHGHTPGMVQVTTVDTVDILCDIEFGLVWQKTKRFELRSHDAYNIMQHLIATLFQRFLETAANGPRRGRKPEPITYPRWH